MIGWPKSMCKHALTAHSDKPKCAGRAKLGHRSDKRVATNSQTIPANISAQNRKLRKGPFRPGCLVDHKQNACESHLPVSHGRMVQSVHCRSPEVWAPTLVGSLQEMVEVLLRHRPDILFLGDLVTSRDHIGRLKQRLESDLHDEWFVKTNNTVQYQCASESLADRWA